MSHSVHVTSSAAHVSDSTASGVHAARAEPRETVSACSSASVTAYPASVTPTPRHTAGRGADGGGSVTVTVRASYVLEPHTAVTLHSGAPFIHSEPSDACATRGTY